MTEFQNPLKQLWQQGKPAVNGWLSIASVLSAEIMSRAGWDSLTIDLQHGTADYADMLAMMPVVQATGTAAIVRVPWNEPSIVMRALDAGAHGVICPMIETADDAALFVKSCLYPPRGARSFGPIRARLVHGDGYGAAANDQILPIAMIETRSAIDNLDSILDVEGIGAVYIGPADLSSALGHPPGFDRREPEIVEVIEEILLKSKARGIPACIHCGSAAYAAEMLEKGFSLATLSTDAKFLETEAKSILGQTRKLLG